MTLLRRDITIINRKGLHARAAAKVVKLCNQFEAEIIFCRNDFCAPGRSILDLLMLAASQGTQMTITGTGSDAEKALDALDALIRDGFGEEDCGCACDHGGDPATASLESARHDG